MISRTALSVQRRLTTASSSPAFRIPSSMGNIVVVSSLPLFRNTSRYTRQAIGVSNFWERQQSRPFLSVVKKAVASVLPKKVSVALGLREATKLEIQQEQIKSTIEKVFKDAPLPLRLMSKLVAPMISKIGANLASQQEEITGVINEGKTLIIKDQTLYNILSSDSSAITASPPIQQSSQSMNVNRESKSYTNIKFIINGDKSEGVVDLTSQNGNIQKLVVSFDGYAPYDVLAASASTNSSRLRDKASKSERIKSFDDWGNYIGKKAKTSDTFAKEKSGDKVDAEYIDVEDFSFKESYKGRRKGGSRYD